MQQEHPGRLQDHWQERFEKLADFCRSIEWKPDSGSFFDELAGLVLKDCGCDAVTLREFTVTDCRIVGAAFADESEAARIRETFAFTPINVGRMADMMEQPATIILDYENPGVGDDSGQFRSAASLGFRSSLIIKLIKDNELFGDMVVSSRKSGVFDPESVSYLESLAKVVSSFMEFHRISERQAEAVVLDECRRLMGEVRANQMNYLNAVRLEGEQALNALWENDRTSLEEQLRMIEKTSSAAIDSLRDDMVMAFRASGGSQPVVEQMEQLLSRFEYMWSIDTELKATDAARAARLSPLALQQVVRMAHEALSNVNRHAHASMVVVEMDAQDDHLIVRIKDDGNGFDASKAPGANIGLKTMHERLELAGGSLSIDSVPGEGTAVVALVPVDVQRGR